MKFFIKIQFNTEGRLISNTMAYEAIVFTNNFVAKRSLSTSEKEKRKIAAQTIRDRKAVLLFRKLLEWSFITRQTPGDVSQFSLMDSYKSPSANTTVKRTARTAG